MLEQVRIQSCLTDYGALGRVLISVLSLRDSPITKLPYGVEPYHKLSPVILTTLPLHLSHKAIALSLAHYQDEAIFLQLTSWHNQFAFE